MFAIIKFAKTQQQLIFLHLEEYLSIVSVLAAALTHHNAGRYRQLSGRCNAVVLAFGVAFYK